MTRDDIIRLAHEANFEGFGNGDWVCTTEEIERFAALVAAHTLANIDPSKFMSYQEGYEAGQFAEREQCATIAKDWDKDHPNTNYGGCIAKAIRERGKA